MPAGDSTSPILPHLPCCLDHLTNLSDHFGQQSLLAMQRLVRSSGSEQGQTNDSAKPRNSTSIRLCGTVDDCHLPTYKKKVTHGETSSTFR
jgi:hypothetical protein